MNIKRVGIDLANKPFKCMAWIIRIRLFYENSYGETKSLFFISFIHKRTNSLIFSIEFFL
jgi:hypothetical protein